MSFIETRKKILSNSMELFAEKGYSAVRTREIASLSEISEVTLYRHFASKKEIYISVFETFHQIPDFKAIGEKMNGSLFHDIYLLSSIFIEASNHNRKLLEINFRDDNIFPEIDNELKKLPEMLNSFLKDYLIRQEWKGKEDVDMETVCHVYVSSLFGLFHFHIMNHSDSSTSLDKKISFLSKCFVQGLLN